MSMRAVSALVAVGLAVALANVVAVPAYAATLTVNATADTGAAPGSCILRDAIESANTDTATGGCAAGNGADTIEFSVSGTIVLGSTLPVIGSDITINGPLAGDIAISGNDAVRVFDIAAGGSLSITGLTIRDGFLSSASDGAGFRNLGTLDIVDSVITENVSGFSGGGIENRGVLTVTGSTITANSAVFSGGGIRTTSSGAVGPVTATVTGSTISGNTLSSGFGSGAGIQREGGALIVRDSTFAANAAPGDGGAIRSIASGFIEVSGSTFTANTAGIDGGALQLGNDTGEVSTSSFAGNTAGRDGGAIDTALFVQLSVADSTFSQNRATTGAGGAVSAGGNASVISSTFTANRAVFGGAIAHSSPSGAITVQSSTIVGNTSDDVAAAAGIWHTGAGATISGSILSGGIGCAGTIVDGGYNIDSGATCGFSAPVGAAWGSNVGPGLGALADNGGPTQTMVPLAGSPAIDAIPVGVLGCPATTPALPTDLATDQRGVVRPQGVGCDIGAVDIVAPVVDVVYTVSPFGKPLLNLPKVNTLKPGESVPIKFAVTDADDNRVRGLDGADVVVSVVLMKCGTTAPIVVDLDVITGTGLKEKRDGTYQFNLKTQKKWAGLCGTLTVTTPHDGERAANVKFRSSGHDRDDDRGKDRDDRHDRDDDDRGHHDHRWTR